MTEIKFLSRSWDDETEMEQESSSKKASSLPLTPRSVAWASDLHRCHRGARWCGSAGQGWDAGPGRLWEVGGGQLGREGAALSTSQPPTTRSQVYADPQLETRHLRPAKQGDLHLQGTELKFLPRSVCL